MAMSALDQKQTSEHNWIMSALPPKADIGTQSRNVRFVPKADSCSAAKKGPIRAAELQAQLSSSVAPLVELDAERLDDGAPADDVGLEPLTQRLGRGAAGDIAGLQ